MPRFSIILPIFNAEATLAETLDAILAQRNADWEAICIDDGSTDESASILSHYATRDSRFIVTCHPGKGPSAARNHGAKALASGQVLAFCDADDIWEHDKLDRLDAMFAQPDCDAVFGQVAFYPGETRESYRLSTVPSGPLTMAMLLAENPVCTMSNLSIRSGVFATCGGFDGAMVHNEDLDFLTRLVSSGATILGDPALHLRYRTDGRGLSSNLADMRQGRLAVLKRVAEVGHRPDPAQEAIFLRYLTRRALRMDDGATDAWRFAMEGLALSPRAYLSPARRGIPTALGAMTAPLLPKPLRRALFAA